MSLMVDLLADALDILSSCVTVASASDRGRLRLLTLLGVAGIAVSLWLSANSADPLRAVLWSGMTLVAVIVVAATGLAVSIVHLVRYRTEAFWAGACFMGNTIALFAVWRLFASWR